DAIGRICAEAEARWQLGADVSPEDIEIVDGHVGLGYARSRPEELATIRDVCRSDGVVLDPVSTGKALHGVVTELRRDPSRFGATIAFLHTGGLVGLFASPQTVAQASVSAAAAAATAARAAARRASRAASRAARRGGGARACRGDRRCTSSAAPSDPRTRPGCPN